MPPPSPPRTDPSAGTREEPLAVSVIVNTNARRESLSALLRALAFQRHVPFEIVVVCGPAPDGTRAMVAEAARAGRLKMALCEEANLALSRNIGLQHAAGAIVAFIDDDAIPEPVWLEELVALFADREVAGAGGRVYGPDGRSLQFRHGLCDRFGDTAPDRRAPDEAASFPLSAAFPHLMGTNALFRREAVVRVGGFDEFYSYYLEETDLCVRLMDEGGRIRQTGRAPVHHRFLPGTARGEEARIRPVLRSRIYFPLVNARHHAPIDEILERSLAFVAERRARVRGALAANVVHPLAEAEFEEDAEAAWREALLAGLSGRRRLRPPGDFADPPAFRPYRSHGAEGPARHVVLLAEGRRSPVPPEAFALARRGDLVRVLHPATAAGQPEDVGFDEGVFTQAVPVEHAYEGPPDAAAPERAIWPRAAALLAEIDRLHAVRPVDAVVALDPLLAAAARRAGRFRLLDALGEAGAIGRESPSEALACAGAADR